MQDDPDKWTAEDVISFIEIVERDGIPTVPSRPIHWNKGFQILIDGGLAFQLGRKFTDEASRLIDEGRCTPPHKIFCVGCID